MNSKPYLKNQMGAGLMEVLVSLLILAIGLLGVVSLQSKGLGSNQQAMFVTEAHFLAQDMADRMVTVAQEIITVVLMSLGRLPARNRSVPLHVMLVLSCNLIEISGTKL